MMRAHPTSLFLSPSQPFEPLVLVLRHDPSWSSSMGWRMTESGVEGSEAWSCGISGVRGRARDEEDDNKEEEGEVEEEEEPELAHDESSSDESVPEPRLLFLLYFSLFFFIVVFFVVVLNGMANDRVWSS
jgi:hypothetical protein